ncbi:MAG: hypothetical protein WC814_01555 [Candidatus Paceibacterota bacterium]
MSDKTVLSVEVGTGPSTGFCCEKPPGHDEGHERSGIFGPFGIKWQIVW